MPLRVRNTGTNGGGVCTLAHKSCLTFSVPDGLADGNGVKEARVKEKRIAKMLSVPPYAGLTYIRRKSSPPTIALSPKYPFDVLRIPCWHAHVFGLVSDWI